MFKRILTVCLILLLCGSAWSGVDFDEGSTEYLSQADGLSTDIVGADQPISVCSWVAPGRVDGGNMSLGSKYNITSGDVQYLLYKWSGGYSFFISIDGTTGGGAEAYGTTEGSVNVPTFICGVYNDTDIRLYVDGVLDSNGADNPKVYSAGIFNGDEPFAIGRHEQGSGYLYLDGKVLEEYVWDSAITADQVLLMYNSKVKGIGRQIQPANLQLYCALDQCADGTACSSNFNCSPGSDMAPTNTPTGAAEVLLTYP